MPKAVLQCIGVGSLHRCTKSKVYLQLHKPAVSLFCRVALSSKHCIMPKAAQRCWATAQLYEEEILTGVIAVSLTCSKPFCRAALSIDHHTAAGHAFVTVADRFGFS